MKRIVSILFITVAFSSCVKLLDQKLQSAIDAGGAFKTKEDIEAGIIGIYSNFQAGSYYGVDYILAPDLEADNLDHTGSDPAYQQLKNRGIDPSNTTITFTWSTLYDGINRTNTVIDGAGKITDPSFNKDQAIAECDFLRAYIYFDLVRFYGGDPSGYAAPDGQGIPIVLTPTFTVADAVAIPKSTAKEVFDQINTDLDFAIANLSNDNGLGRANVNAAIALKARVALYQNDFTTAEDLATQIIDQFSGATVYGGLALDYASIFTAKNVMPESIFELQFDATNSSFLFFYYFGRYEVTSSADLGAAYEPNDTRLPVNYYSYAGSFGTLKYGRADGSDDVLLIRLAEMYLIRAEARARKSAPDIAGAIADLNIVRARAGIEPTTAATADDLFAAIIIEDRLEFAHEAHRWFDLRRTGMAADFFGIADPRKVLWPIPQQEVLNSGGVITQNPGY